MMAEEGFIQFIWKHRLYDGKLLFTSCGQKLEVLSPGEQNPHGGPDFLNARIRTGGLIWAGNVEIHRLASDWYRHRHHLDMAYNNVILHVVEHFDTDVTTSMGRRILTMVPEYPAELSHRHEILKRSDSWLACGEFIRTVSADRLKRCLYLLGENRALQKSLNMQKILHEAGFDLNLALFRALAPGYGLPLNTLPFELLLKRITLPVLIKYRDSVIDLEALLFGHSGLLSPARGQGTYPSTLWNRYQEIKSHLAEKPVPFHLWKFLRLRPPSFPTLRISQFAALIHRRYPLADSILGSASLSELEQILRVEASEYWTNHYLFGKASPPFPKYPGHQFITTLIINVLLPFLTALDSVRGKYGTIPGAKDILKNLKAESNGLIKNWSIFGIRPDNAKESQALLQLYHHYCKQKRCLECFLGTEIVRNAIQ